MATDITWIAAISLVAVIVAKFSAAISSWFAQTKPRLSIRKRSTFSALGASGVLAVLPIIVVLIESGLAGAFLIVLVNMAVGAVFCAAVSGFPATCWGARTYRIAGKDQVSE